MRDLYVNDPVGLFGERELRQFLRVQRIAVNVPDCLALRLADGTEQVMVDDANAIDQTLYALGTEDRKTVTYALAQTFALDQVTAVVLNGTAYPLH